MQSVAIESGSFLQSRPVVCWTLRTLKALVVLFLVFDALTKLLREPHVVAAFAREGMSGSLTMGIGALLAALVALYVVPQTSLFGAILLTGYLGGATAINLRAGDPPFECLFPVIFGILVWTPVYLRDARVRALFPIHRLEER